MTQEFADVLAKRYLNSLEREENTIFSIMDLFDNNKEGALMKLSRSDIRSVHLNY